MLLAVGGSGGDDFVDIWIRYGPQAQLLWLSFTSAFLLVALKQRVVIDRAAKLQPQSIWLVEAVSNSRLKAKLTVLASILNSYMAIYIVLSVLSGAFDRQFDVYLNWTQQLWRLDTPVSAFSRLRDLWFLLFPLWWRLLGNPWRLFMAFEMLAFLLNVLLSGSRGLLFYPALMVLFGLWFVLHDPRLLRRLAIGLATLFLVLSPLIYVVRDSYSFQNAQGWSTRLQSVGFILMKPSILLAQSRWLGRDLYACHDPFLFTDVNLKNPPVGHHGLHALLYLWIPRHVMPNRPVIFDGHLIAKKLQGIDPLAANAWFPCFSLPADLMRRWSVPGLILGGVIVASLSQLLLYFWYKTISVSGTTFQLLLFLFPATYLQSFPFGTVQETAWSLFWELPKYLVVLWLIGAGVDRYLERSSV